MKLSSITLATLATTTLVPLAAQAAFAAESSKPMFKVLPAHGIIHQFAHALAALRTWNGTIQYDNNNYNFTMVGTDPSSSDVTTTVDIFLIPVKMTYSKKVYGQKFIADPMKDRQNGVSIVQNLLNSPLFNALDWNWGGTDFGNTQYTDAFQRGSFWGSVGGTNMAYHVVLAATVLTEQTIKVSKAQGGAIATEFGVKVGLMNLNAFDSFVQTTLGKFSSQINPSNFPIFVTDNAYLTSGGCCIGGYHSVDNNGQTYAMATYIPKAGVFSQDISSFSHEIGEWYDDPLITSNSPCGPLDVGGPLGDFDVVFNGVTWHPQALLWMEYFGEPANFSGNNWLDDQHIETSVCENGP